MILECLTLLCLAGLDGGGDYVPAPRQEVRTIQEIVEPPIPQIGAEPVAIKPDPEPPVEEPKPAQGNTAGTSTTQAVGNVWQRLAVCESGMGGVPRWDYNGGSGFDGGIQFHPGTWTAFKPSEYPAYAYQATPAQQIAVGRKVAAAQGAGAWPSCTSKLGISTQDLLN